MDGIIGKNYFWIHQIFQILLQLQTPTKYYNIIHNITNILSFGGRIILIETNPIKALEMT